MKASKAGSTGTVWQEEKQTVEEEDLQDSRRSFQKQAKKSQRWRGWYGRKSPSGDKNSPIHKVLGKPKVPAVLRITARTQESLLVSTYSSRIRYTSSQVPEVMSVTQRMTEWEWTGSKCLIHPTWPLPFLGAKNWTRSCATLYTHHSSVFLILLSKMPSDCRCMEARGQPWVSSLGMLSSTFETAGQRMPPYLAFSWFQELKPKSSCLQGHCQLSYVPSPCCLGSWDRVSLCSSGWPRTH